MGFEQYVANDDGLPSSVERFICLEGLQAHGEYVAHQEIMFEGFEFICLVGHRLHLLDVILIVLLLLHLRHHCCQWIVAKLLSF